MRITAVSVKKLFGMFDHEISLNQESRITIIHGPNGVGKTVLMELVNSLFRYGYGYICSVPFEDLSVSFDCGGISAKVVDEYISRSSKGVPLRKTCRLLLDYFGAGPLRSTPFAPWITYYNSTDWEPDYADHPYLIEDESGINAALQEEQLSNYVKVPYALGDSMWLDIYTYDMYTKAEILDKFPQVRKKIYGNFPSWFKKIHKETNIIFVKTQRLRELAYDEKNPPMQIGADEIHEYVAFQTTIDLHKDFRLNSPVDEDALEGWALFEEIVNERLLFKSLKIDDDEWMITIINENGAELGPDDLSSGEQQLLVLYYKLLFETEPDTLVMIDEPELSMNVVWQRNFLKDLQRIIELRNFDVLIATHSPQIIHDKWDWVVHLGEKVDD